MRGAAVALALLTILLAPAADAGDAAARASLPDIEDEVMCPICGTLLELSTSPQAERERVFVRKQIAEGRTKEQIKDMLVAEYGQEVLAVPDDSGFDLTAYWVPILGFVIGASALAIGVARWRRRAARGQGEEQVAAPRGEDAARLESDLSRYDL